MCALSHFDSLPLLPTLNLLLLRCRRGQGRLVWTSCAPFLSQTIPLLSSPNRSVISIAHISSSCSGAWIASPHRLFLSPDRIGSNHIASLPPSNPSAAKARPVPRSRSARPGAPLPPRASQWRDHDDESVRSFSRGSSPSAPTPYAATAALPALCTSRPRGRSTPALFPRLSGRRRLAATRKGKGAGLSSFFDLVRTIIYTQKKDKWSQPLYITNASRYPSLMRPPTPTLRDCNCLVGEAATLTVAFPLTSLPSPFAFSSFPAPSS